MNAEIEARFWEEVAFLGASKSECWPWTGAKTSNRYGGRYGEITFGKKKYATHRLSFEIHNGRPANGHVLHSCDNPPCCNPAHLREGGYVENMNDKLSRHGGSKLTVQQVKTIRALDKAGMRPYRIAKMFGISPEYEYRIVRWLSWSWVDY